MTDTAAETLTARQRRVLEFVRTSTADQGYPPSLREIGDAVGLSSINSVHYQLRVLERKGLLRRDVGRPRAITITDTAEHACSVQSGRLQEALEFVAARRDDTRHSPRRCWEMWPEDRARWCMPCVAQYALDPWTDREATA